MATNMDAMIRIAARVDGANTIQAFSRDLRGLDGAAKISGGTLQRMNGVINRMAREAGNTTSGIRAHIAALENLRSRVEIGGSAYNRLGAQVDQLRGKLRSLDGEAKRSGLGISQVVSGAAGALLAGAGIAGAGATVGLIARAGIDAETAQVRLKALTEQFGEYNQAQAAAARIAQTLRISQTEATDSFSKLYGALRPTGVTLREVEDAFVGFTAAARAGGSTATESSAALLQLKQALGSGVLQGDELRSIREQAPAAAQAIAREMGVTIGELKKLGSEGKITTDIVLRALARLKGESLGKLNAQFNTSAQALQDLRVSADQFGQTIARVFGPAAVATVRGLGAAIREVNAVMGALTGDGGAQGRIQDMQRARSQAQQDTNRRPFGLFDAQGKQSFFQQRTQQLFQQFQRQRADQASRAAAASGASAGQLAERQAAERERMLGRQRAAAAAAPGGGGAGEGAAQSNLNQLLIENLRLNTELGNVGKDRISQLNAEIDLIPQVLKLQLSVLNASVKGKDLQQARINAITEARARSAQLEEELEGVNKEVGSIATQAAALRAATMSGLGPRQSPLAEEIQRVKEELLDADTAAAELLSRLSELAGTNPVSGAARAAIGNLRGDLAGADPSAIASQRLVQGDVDALRQQVVELQNAGRELSTLEQLAMKYGAEWDQIDPKIRASVGALAEQKDKLQENVDKTKEWNDTLNQAGTTIGGVLSDLVTGTDDWKSSLSGALKALANMAFQSALMGLAGNDGRGVFSFLTGTLKSFDGGGYTGSGPKSGGLDGKGGFMAMLHPRETVIDHTRAMPRQGAGNPINVVVNVDAKGTQVEGNQTEGAQLGRVISAAVQAELVKQQRPGGILAGTRR